MKKAKQHPVKPVTLWAVIVHGKRSSWIDWGTVRKTKKWAWDAHCMGWDADDLKRDLRTGELELRKVTITA